MRSTLELTLLPGADRVAAVHRPAGAQPDNLCGAFWVSLLLRSAGSGSPTPERAAAAAGTVLPAGGDPRSWVPPGEPNRPGDTATLARSDDPDVSGTSVPGMLAAVDELSGGSYRLVPIRGHAGRALDGSAIATLVGILERHPRWEATPILNLRTGALWGTRLPLTGALTYLAGGDVNPPDPEWDVGHFVNIAGLVRGPERTMLLLRDSYPSFGSGGSHLQPLEAVGSAVRRDDGREGGCLLFLAARHLDGAERALKDEGYDIGTWDNGTPYGQGGER